MNATEQIDAYVASLGGWKQTSVRHWRAVIRAAAPELTETWKWTTPVFARGTVNVVGIGVFKDSVRLNFFRGALLADPAGLFNAGLEAKTSRGIDLREGQTLDESALTDLLRRAAIG
jgi:hypothetical protein